MTSKYSPEIYQTNEYVSDYESESNSQLGDAAVDASESEIHPLKDAQLTAKPAKAKFPAYASSKAVLDEEQRRSHNAIMRHQLLSLDAYDRHKKLVNDYLQYYGGKWKDFERDSSNDKRDIDVIREHGRFLWSDTDEPANWSERLAKRYWDKLFKEYCLVDVSRYKENKFGMRWRLEKEVISGKGQFSCGNVRCSSNCRLRSWEVNFCYKERGERRNALVKLRLCPDCSDKLNYRHKRREVVREDVSRAADAAPTEEDDKAPSDNQKQNETSAQTDSSTEPPTKRTRSEGEDIWRAPVDVTAGSVKTQEEEFDDYFRDMLL